MCCQKRPFTIGLAYTIIITSILACSSQDEQNQDIQQPWPALTSVTADFVRDLDLIDFPQQQKRSDSSGMSDVLKDIVSHLPTEVSERKISPDMATWAYESTLGVHDVIRERYNRSGRNVAGIYLLNDKAAVIVEPKILKKRTAEFIPQAFHGENHDLYVLGQTIYDNRPLYLLEELIARVNTAAVALENRIAHNAAESDSLGFSGLIEFTTYNIALAMAIQEYDPKYFVENKQFTSILGIAIERALILYRLNKNIGNAQTSTREDDIYQLLIRGAEGNSMRAFTARLYGNQWFNRSFIKDQPVQLALNKTVIAALIDTLPKANNDDEKDSDGDGIPDRLDQCPQSKEPTSKPVKVWTYGNWIGCAEGEQRQ